MTSTMEAMKPSTLLRSLSSKIQSRLSPPPVAPWPTVRSAFDQWLTAELDELRLQPHQPDRCMSGAWHSKSLGVAVAAQKMAAKFIATAGACLNDAERKMVDDYLDDTVELLEACNGLRERLEAIREYTDSLAVALHCIEGGDNISTAAMRRAMITLESCEAMEKRCAKLERCVSNLGRLGKKLTNGAARYDAFGANNSTIAVEFHEALSGSRAVALLVLGVLGVAISVKSRRGLPAVRACKTVHWATSLHELYKEVKEEFDKRRKGGVVGLHELSRTASAAQSLRDSISRGTGGEEMKAAAENLRRRCGELEGRVKLFGESFNELYRQLIVIRMPLLGLGRKEKALSL